MVSTPQKSPFLLTSARAAQSHLANQHDDRKPFPLLSGDACSGTCLAVVRDSAQGTSPPSPSPSHSRFHPSTTPHSHTTRSDSCAPPPHSLPSPVLTSLQIDINKLAAISGYTHASAQVILGNARRKIAAAGATDKETAKQINKAARAAKHKKRGKASSDKAGVAKAATATRGRSTQPKTATAAAAVAVAAAAAAAAATAPTATPAYVTKDVDFEEDGFSVPDYGLSYGYDYGHDYGRDYCQYYAHHFAQAHNTGYYYN